MLRQKLFPDPAAAAAAAATAKQTRHAKRSKSAAGPSKATAAAIAAATAAAAAAKQLPPVVLKSQIYTVLTDRTAADRDLEDLRQQGRVRVFKLAIGATISQKSNLCSVQWVVCVLEGVPTCKRTCCTSAGVSMCSCGLGSVGVTYGSDALHGMVSLMCPCCHAWRAGADEYVLLLADDYLDIINKLLHKHQQLAMQPSQQQQQPTAGSSCCSSAADSAGMVATLQHFRDNVVPAWHEASIPRSKLLQLLRMGTSSPAAGGHPVSDAAHERHLLALELVTRDSRSTDSYLLTVPGAAAFVKSVLTGRQEVLQMLSRKK